MRLDEYRHDIRRNGMFIFRQWLGLRYGETYGIGRHCFTTLPNWNCFDKIMGCDACDYVPLPGELGWMNG
jgi:hypothetical protein